MGKRIKATIILEQGEGERDIHAKLIFEPMVNADDPTDMQNLIVRAALHMCRSVAERSEETDVQLYG